MRYDWPGNVRELRNFLETALAGQMATTFAWKIFHCIGATATHGYEPGRHGTLARARRPGLFKLEQN